MSQLIKIYAVCKFSYIRRVKGQNTISLESGKRSFNKAFLYFTISSFLHIQMILCSVCRRLTLGLTNITSESFIMLTSLHKIKCCENNYV